MIFLLCLNIHTDSTPHFIFRIPNGFTNSYYSNPNLHASKAVQHFQNGKNKGVGNGRNHYTTNIASEQVERHGAYMRRLHTGVQDVHHFK